ncbi:MAG: sugar transferase [Deltaproteobacteria bacterium]|nr:sugar transferase [Deltaproteobacteria bacterium]
MPVNIVNSAGSPFPLFLILALLIKATSPGPVFFKQKRIGTNNVEFDIYKFRSSAVSLTNRLIGKMILL